jgi:hypothetical protein
MVARNHRCPDIRIKQSDMRTSYGKPVFSVEAETQLPLEWKKRRPSCDCNKSSEIGA